MASAGTVFEDGQFIEAPAMAVFDAASPPVGPGLLVPLPGPWLRRLKGATLRSAVRLTGRGSAALRFVVLTVQTGDHQLVCAVPVVDLSTRSWLIDGVERYGLLRLVLQHNEKPEYAVSRCRLPVPERTSQAWQDFRGQLLSAPMRVGPADEIEALDELMRDIEQLAPSIVPGVRRLERRVFVCWPDDGKQAAIVPEDPEDYGYAV